jgi:hypothetical protein
MEEHLHTDSDVISLSGVASGLYFVQINNSVPDKVFKK